MSSSKISLRIIINRKISINKVRPHVLKLSLFYKISTFLIS